MAEEYTVLQFKKGDFKDNNGNYWCDMALQGVGEPVRIAVRDPQQFHDDMTLYGRVEEKTSQAGKTYLRFYREQKEEVQEAPTHVSLSGTQPAVSRWEPKDNDVIRAQFAIKSAIALVTGGKGLFDE